MKKLIIFLTFLFSGFLISCGSTIKDGPPAQYVNATDIPNAVPKVEPKSRYGNPSSYIINGHRYYVLKSARGYDKKGIASWYGTKFHGHLTATREPYDMFAMTAASTELPLPTYVRVTNLDNGRQVIVKVNDRGPFDEDRILDLSYAAAKKLRFAENGTALVEVTAIDVRTKKIKNPQIYLQIGSFARQNNADHLQAQIAPLTKAQVQINNGTYHNKPIYKVQIGPLASVEENDHLQKLLTTKGLQSITVIK